MKDRNFLLIIFMAGKDTFIQHRKLDGCRYACETKTGANNVDFIPAEYSPHPTPPPYQEGESNRMAYRQVTDLSVSSIHFPSPDP